MTGLRKALIVANDEYEHEGLRHLLAPAADAAALAGVLGDPRIGDFDVHVVRNESAHRIEEQIEDLFSDSRADDVLLLHFSCHGLKSESGELFFAARNTRPNRLGSTAVSADFVQRCMRASRSRSIVLLLDCCYGGAFSRGVTVRAAGEVNVLDSFPGGKAGGGRGRAVITASSAMEYAFEGDQLADDHSRRPSVFTSALVEGLATGDADRDQDGWVSLNELYDYVFDRVREQNPNQTPSRDVEMQGELYLARRGRPVSAPAPLPAELQQVIDHPLAGIRAGAVGELARLLRGGHAGLALAARTALERLAGDDSRVVAASAAAALGTAPGPPGGYPAGPPDPVPPTTPKAPPDRAAAAAPAGAGAAAPAGAPAGAAAAAGAAAGAPAAAGRPARQRPTRRSPVADPARRRRRLRVGVAAVAVLALAGTGTGIALTWRHPAGPSTGSSVTRVGLMLTKDGRDDLGANGSAVDGAARAKRKYGARLQIMEVTPNQSSSNRRLLLDDLVNNGADVVFVVNDGAEDDVAAAARKHPDEDFVLIGGYDPLCDQRANLVCDLSKTQEGTFLAGAAAALKSASHVVGFIGAEPYNREAAQVGYQAGVTYVDKRNGTRTTLLVDHTDGDSAASKALAQKQLSHGADVLYHDAYLGSDGVIQACAAHRRYVIGAYFDLSLPASVEDQKWILTSMVVRVDNVIAQDIDAYLAGTLKGGQAYIGVAANGIDYVRNAYNKDLLGTIPATLDDIRAKITTGAIHVPDKLAG